MYLFVTLITTFAQNGRKAFGHCLIKQPLMRNLLTDLCIESEAHTFNAMYMARAFDRYYTANNDVERELFRIGVSVSKYYVTKRLPGFVYECMEAMGGNGYVEDFPMARYAPCGVH
jgi:putative acyl-CoA dehydrogenase